MGRRKDPTKQAKKVTRRNKTVNTEYKKFWVTKFKEEYTLIDGGYPRGVVSLFCETHKIDLNWNGIMEVLN